MLSDSLRRFAVLAAFAVPALAHAQNATKTFEGFRPGPCGWVPRMVAHFLHRDPPDSSAFDPRRDTLDTAARDSVRICSAGYSTIHKWEELEHSRVQLIVGRDADAAETTRKYLSGIPDSSVEKTAWSMWLSISDMLSVHPARMQAATEATARLDKLGAKAARASVLAHTALAQVARSRWDDTTAKKEASVAISQWRTLSPDAALVLSSSAYAAFAQKAEIELRLSGGDAARAVIDTAQRSLPAGSGAARQVGLLVRLYSLAGRKAPPIQPAYWFRLPDTASTRPHPGKLFIISEATHTCGQQCRPRYQSLTRLEQRFGKRGLEVINITRTLGFIRDTAAIEPVDEARYDSTFFLGERKIPGSLAVFETKYRWLPDGRRVNERTPQDQNYSGASVTLVDKSGTIRYASFGWDPIMEEPIARLIEKLLSPDSQ